MPTLATTKVHEAVSTRSQFQYQFTPKHHGADRKAAQWLPALTLKEEFAVFNQADWHHLADAQGNFFGAQRDGTDGLSDLGTRYEQVAKFPVTAANQTWHGYPAWPLATVGEDRKPPKAVLKQMEAAGIITVRGRKRLEKGDPV